MQNVFQFHSTLAYLKNPPPGYPLPAVDLIEGLKNISATITSGRYTNEYDIEVRTFNLLILHQPREKSRNMSFRVHNVPCLTVSNHCHNLHY